jgi:hypothetical protein
MYFQNAMVHEHRIDIPIPKRRNRREENFNRFQVNPKSQRENSIKS